MVLESITSLIILYPIPSVIVISLLVSIFINIINYFVMPKDRIRELKEIQKACQIKLKDAKGDMNKMNEINKQMLECSAEMMKHSFKPMLITFIPIIIVFAFIRSAYATTSIAGSWIWYYIISSLVFSMILRKLFKLP